MGWLLLLAAAGAAAARAADPEAELISVAKIWDQAPHNAFTDLVRHQDRFWCVFREGQAHVSPDGAVRVLSSADGAQWQPAARIVDERGDLRDPKLSILPDGRLLLLAAAAIASDTQPHHQSLVWTSRDGSAWSEPVEVGQRDWWLWRVAWHGPAALGVGYATRGGRATRLYRASEPERFEIVKEVLFDEGYPNEAGLAFTDNTLWCLLRRDGQPDSAQLGRSEAPFSEWSWRDLGLRIGGPALARLPDGRLLAAGRLYDPPVRTALLWLDPQRGTLREFLALPSGGDTSYPGLVWHDDRLWVSYYSSHEGRTSIYLAQVKLFSRG